MGDRINVVVGLAMRRDRTMLMARRHIDRMRPNQWEHPGGKVEPADGPFEHGGPTLDTKRAALAREWKEELGVTVVPEFKSVGVVQLDLEERFNIWMYPVIIWPPEQEPRPLDAQELRWVTPEVAMRYLACVPATWQLFPKIVETIDGWLASR